MAQGDSIVFPKNFDFSNLKAKDRVFCKIITCPECNHVFFIDIKAIIEKFSKESVKDGII